MAKPLWQQLLDGTYDPMRAVTSGSSGGGWRDDGTFESSWEARERREREQAAEERARAARERREEQDRARRELQDAKRDRAEAAREQELADWIAVGRGRDEDLRQLNEQQERRLREAQALGVDEDGTGAPPLLQTIARGLDTARAFVFEGSRQQNELVGEMLRRRAGGDADESWMEFLGGQVDTARERFDRREGFGDLDLLEWDEDDEWWQRTGKALGAFAGDVAWDPLTYLSFGTASIGRRAAAEGADVAARKLGQQAVTQVSDDVARSLARRVSPTEIRKTMADAAERAGQELTPAQIQAMTPDATWQLARQLPGDPGLSFAQSLAQRGLGAGSAESYLEAGSRGLYRFLTRNDTLGREVGEQVFDAMPGELRGGVRARVPFMRTRQTETGVDLGIGLPTTVNVSRGGGRTSSAVPGLDRVLDGAEWPRRLFRQSRAGQATTRLLGGREGGPYGQMVARLSDVTDGEVGRLWSDYSAFVATNREVARKSGELSREIGSRFGTYNAALGAATDRGTAEEALRRAFMSRGTWGATPEARQAYVDTLSGDERIGFEVASQGFDLFQRLRDEAVEVFGERRAIGFLNDYLPRKLRQEYKDAMRSAGRGGARMGSDHMRARTGVFAVWEEVDGVPQIRRFLSPDEANEAAGMRMFEDDPLTIMATYANSMEQAIRRQRLLTELEARGLITPSTFDANDVLSSPQMAQVGAEAVAAGRDAQDELRDAFRQFAATGDRAPIRDVLARRGVTVPERSRGRRPEPPAEDRPRVVRMEDGSRRLVRPEPDRAGRPPSVPEARVAEARRLTSVERGFARSADGRVEVRKGEGGWTATVDGEPVRPAGADDVLEAPEAPVAAPEPPPVVFEGAPDVVEQVTFQHPLAMWRAVEEAGGTVPVDGNERIAEALLSVNEGLDVDQIVRRRLSDAEHRQAMHEAKIDRVPFRDDEYDAFAVAPERVPEAQARVRATLDQMADLLGWNEGDDPFGVGAALASRRRIDLGNLDDETFAQAWPIIDTLTGLGWELKPVGTDWDPALRAFTGAVDVLVPPGGRVSNAASAEAAEALRRRGLDLQFEPRKQRPRYPKVDVEVDLPDLSPAARQVVTAGDAARYEGGRLVGTLAGMRGGKNRMGTLERINTVLDGIGKRGLRKEARRKAGIGDVRITEQVQDELVFARNQIAEAMDVAERGAYDRLPEVYQLQYDLRQVRQQLARLERATGRSSAAERGSRYASAGQADRDMAARSARRAEAQARYDREAPALQARQTELEQRLEQVEAGLDADPPVSSRPVPRTDRDTDTVPVDVDGPPVLEPAATFPTRKAAVAAADEAAAEVRQSAARRGYNQALPEWADQAEQRATWEDVLPPRVATSRPVETPDELAGRQAEWDRQVDAVTDFDDRAREADDVWAAQVGEQVDRVLEDLARDMDRVAELFDARNVPVDPVDADRYMEDVTLTVGRILDRDPDVVQDAVRETRRIQSDYQKALEGEGRVLLASDGMNQTTLQQLEQMGAFGPDWLAEPLARMYRAHGAPTEWQKFEQAVWKPYYTWFKSMATVGGGPRFWIRNMQGGSFNSWLQGVSPRHFELATRVLQVRRQVTRTVKNELGDTSRAAVEVEVNRRLPEALEARFGGERGRLLAEAWRTFDQQNLDQGRMLHVYDNVGPAEQGTAFRTVDQRSLRQQGLRPDLAQDEKGLVLRGLERTMDNPVFDTLADLTEGSERWLRFGTYLHGVEKWGMDDGGVAASMSVKATQFDYTDLSEFEIRYLKNLLPFYTWSRRNIPLQARAVMTEPGKIQRVLHANDALEGQFGAEYEDGDNAVMPRWVRESFGWELGRRPGDDGGTAAPWAVNLGWWPTADLNRTFNATTDPFGMVNTDEVRGAVNPLLKVAAETFTGTSSFTRAPFQPTETAPTWARIIPGMTSETVTGETVTDPQWTNVVRSTVPLVGTFDRLVEPAVRAATGQPVGEDRYRERLGTSAAAQLAGVPVSTLDGRQQRAEMMGRIEQVREAVRLRTGSDYAGQMAVVRELLEAGWSPEQIAAALEANGALPAAAG